MHVPLEVHLVPEKEIYLWILRAANLYLILCIMQEAMQIQLVSIEGVSWSFIKSIDKEAMLHWIILKVHSFPSE